MVQSADDDVLVFTRHSPESRRAQALRRAGVKIVQARGRSGKPDLRAALEALGKRDVLMLLVEAGARLNAAALDAGVVDKLFLFYAPRFAGPGGLPMLGARKSKLHITGTMQKLNLRQFGPDFAVEGYLRDVYRDH